MSNGTRTHGAPPALEAGGPSVSPEGLDPVKMESRKLRPDREASRNLPVRGFGPGGDYTFYLPSPARRNYWTFKNGRPVEVVAAGVADNERIRALRDGVLMTMKAEGPGLLRVEPVFLEYAAAVLLVNYNLTDDDLSFVLRGNKWHAAMVGHVLGGADIVEALRRMLIRAVSPLPSTQLFPPEPPAATLTESFSSPSVKPRAVPAAAPQPSVLRRLLAHARRSILGG